VSSPLLAALEENLHGHFTFVQQRHPGMTVDDRADLLLVDSALPTDTFNKIARARLTEATADRRIAEAVGYFRSRRRPFAWLVGPGSRPLDLDRRLPEHGLHPAEHDLGMALDLADLTSPPDPPPGLDLRRVRTTAELADFAAIGAANWEPPDPSVVSFYQDAAPLLLQPDCPMQLFVGYLDGHPAAASELFVGGGIAGLHGVSTLAAFRGRGLGSALTWAAADQARRLGLPTIILQASSEEGQRVYARLGFRPCCDFVEYQ
jgi:GNAT superfamily N-acetyltransferase